MQIYSLAATFAKKRLKNYFLKFRKFHLLEVIEVIEVIASLEVNDISLC